MTKNKIRFKKTYSKLAVLLIIILLFIFVFKALSDGIKINSLSIASIKIDGLYLKLDKKLILYIDNIDLGNIKNPKEDDKKPINIKEITNIVHRAIWVSFFFQSLDISNIQYANENSSIYYDGEQYKLNLPYILAVFKLQNDGDDIFLDINTLKLKQEELDIKGRILYLKKNDIFAFDLESYINNRLDNVINYQGQTDFKHLNIVVSSTTLNSIDVLAPYIKVLDLDVYDWLYQKAKFSAITINRAYLNIKNLKSRNLAKDIINNLYASGLIENVDLKIEDELSPINTNKVAVIFNKGILRFKTNNASYDGIIADSAQVDISNFLDTQALLKLTINSKKAILDERILGILQYYDIDIPVKQKSGFGDGFINLDILLPSSGHEAVVTPNGFFKIIDSDVEVAGVELFTKEANIEIGPNFVNIMDSHVQFKEILDTKINMKIDTTNKTINLDTNPDKFIFNIGDSEIINFSNQNINAQMDFSGDDFLINFDDYNIDVKVNDIIDININNISKIISYAPILEIFDIKDGSIKLHTQNFIDIDLNAKIDNLNYPIYDLDENKITSISIDGKITDNEIKLWDLEQRLEATITPNTADVDVKINQALININEILDSQIPILKNIKEDNIKTDNDMDILIKGSNINLSLFGYKMELNEAMFKTTKNGFIGNGKNKNGVANIIMENDSININANNFNDEFINKIFNKKVVSGGTFGLLGIYRQNKFLGDITLQDTSIKNMASLQNILALVDAIPSLVVFKLPGFSANGYQIQDGKIRVGVNNDYIALDKININGNSVDIDGEGVINMKTQDLNINLSISTMKSLSSILNKIPIFGYIILGDDGKITTEVEISGTIENPKTELSLLEDTAQAPVNILKRILSPLQFLVDELKKESNEKGNR